MLISNVIDLSNMSIHEGQCFTVLSRLELRESIKEIAVKIMVLLSRNRKCSLNPKGKVERMIAIKRYFEDFKCLMQEYKRGNDCSIAEELKLGFSQTRNALKDI